MVFFLFRTVALACYSHLWPFIARFYPAHPPCRAVLVVYDARTRSEANLSKRGSSVKNRAPAYSASGTASVRTGRYHQVESPSAVFVRLTRYRSGYPHAARHEASRGPGDLGSWGRASPMVTSTFSKSFLSHLQQKVESPIDDSHQMHVTGIYRRKAYSRQPRSFARGPGPTTRNRIEGTTNTESFQVHDQYRVSE